MTVIWYYTSRRGNTGNTDDNPGTIVSYTIHTNSCVRALIRTTDLFQVPRDTCNTENIVHWLVTKSRGLAERGQEEEEENEQH